MRRSLEPPQEEQHQAPTKEDPPAAEKVPEKCGVKRKTKLKKNKHKAAIIIWVSVELPPEKRRRKE